MGALVGTGWLGLQVKPAPFPPAPDRAGHLETIPLPAGLPPPVDRYFRAAMGDRVPIITSAVITGRGHLRVSGVTFPTRLRFTHLAGQGYRHYIECTWLGYPVLRVNETFLDGHARMELPFGVVENEPKVDMAANTNLWGEAIWFPSVYVTDTRVRWEEIDAASARLFVPFEQTEDTFTVKFDPKTGLIQCIEMLRYKQTTDATKTLERFEPLAWQTYHGLHVPSAGALTWMDEGTPWLVMTLDDMAFNGDVSESIRSSGL
jgi:hypothetical protein